MSLTSSDLNLLLYRYLLESGFTHAAFVFAHESLLLTNNSNGTHGAHSSITNSITNSLTGSNVSHGTSNATGSSVPMTDLPPGALIALVQKGLIYSEMETHVNELGIETVCENKVTVYGIDSVHKIYVDLVMCVK